MKEVGTHLLRSLQGCLASSPAMSCRAADGPCLAAVRVVVVSPICISTAQNTVKTDPHRHIDWKHLEGGPILCRLPGRLPAQRCPAE